MIKDIVTQKNLKMSNAVNTASGYVATHENVIANKEPVTLKVNGKCVQDGTPTPDAPVDIIGVGESGSLEVKTCGKNIFGGLPFAQALVDSGSTKVVLDTDAKTVEFTNNSSSTPYVLFDNFKENTQYSIVLKGTHTNSGTATSQYNTNLQWLYTDGTRGNIQASNTGEFTRVSISNANKSVKGIIYAWVEALDKVVLNYEKCGIFEGVITEDEFEPYTETKADIPLYSPLYEGDYIRYNMDGSGELVRKMDSFVFDGSSDEAWADRTSNYPNKREGQYRYSISTNVFYPKNAEYMSTIGTSGYTIVDNYTENGAALYTDRASIIYITCDKADLATFKAWLQSNPITVIYELAEPTVTPLTAEQINAIKGLLSQAPVTNVMSEGIVESGYCANNADGVILCSFIDTLRDHADQIEILNSKKVVFKESEFLTVVNSGNVYSFEKTFTLIDDGYDNQYMPVLFIKNKAPSGNESGWGQAYSSSIEGGAIVNVGCSFTANNQVKCVWSQRGGSAVDFNIKFGLLLIPV